MATADGDGPIRIGSPVHEARHDLGGEAPVSVTVIDAVAAAEGVDPTDSDLELYDAVDLKALGLLFERRSFDDYWRFEFTVRDHVVVVHGDATVAVCDAR